MALPAHLAPLEAPLVHIQSDAVEAIHAMSAAAAPNEGCGYLIGAHGRIESVRATRNLHAEPRTRYQVDPVAFLDLEDELEGTGQEVVGIVHSHPFTDAVPSKTDRAHAAVGWWYLIHGFPPHAPEGILRAWRLHGADGEFREHPLQLTEAGSW